MDYRSNKDPKGSISVFSIPAGKRKEIFTKGSNKINITVDNRTYEFECEDAAIAAKWNNAILTHFPASD